MSSQAPPMAAPGRSTSRHPQADANGDGIITREDARGHRRLEANLDELDTNKDGKVERAEMHEYRQRNRPSGPGADHGQGAGPGSGSE